MGHVTAAHHDKIGAQHKENAGKKTQSGLARADHDQEYEYRGETADQDGRQRCDVEHLCDGQDQRPARREDAEDPSLMAEDEGALEELRQGVFRGRDVKGREDLCLEQIHVLIGRDRDSAVGYEKCVTKQQAGKQVENESRSDRGSPFEPIPNPTVTHEPQPDNRDEQKGNAGTYEGKTKDLLDLFRKERVAEDRLEHRFPLRRNSGHDLPGQITPEGSRAPPHQGGSNAPVGPGAVPMKRSTFPPFPRLPSDHRTCSL